MKFHKSSLVLGLVAGLSIAGAALSLGQGEKKEAKSPRESMQEMMKDPAAMQAAMAKWEETTKTGPMHKGMEKFVGEWSTASKMFMDPSAPPMESKGSATFQMVMGGRYLVQEFKGDMMGMPYEGMGYTGFDNNRKLFVSNWIDSMSTGIMTMKGSLDDTGKIMTQFGEMDEPMTGEMGKVIRSQTTWIDDNTFKFTMAEVMYGEPFVVMEITYTKKK